VQKIHPSLGANSTVAFARENLTDGRVHQRQYGRLLLIGPFSGLQQCLGFAIRLESETSEGLNRYYLQRHEEHSAGDDLKVPTSYLDTSSMVAACMGITYNNASEWRNRETVPPFRAVELSFNNLDRTLKIEQLADRRFAPEPSRRTTAQVGQELTGRGLNVAATV